MTAFQRFLGGLAGWGGMALLGVSPQARPIKVITSFFPVYCLTVNVAGNLAQVENLLPRGMGPHDFQFSPRDLRRLEEADVVVMNGLQLESWLDRAIQSQAIRKPKTIVSLSDGLQSELIFSPRGLPASWDRPPLEPVLAAGPRETQQGANPHIWLDPLLAAHGVTNILRALQQADPTNASGYAVNAQVFCGRLVKLDDDLRAGLAQVTTQAFLTYHQAFPYLARRYGLKLVGVVEEVPDVEPSPRYLAQLAQIIRDEHVKVIFTEPQYSSRLAQQIARDQHLAVAELDTLETGPPTPAGYEEAMRRNLRRLVEHLR